jgi:hypothetical protein
MVRVNSLAFFFDGLARMTLKMASITTCTANPLLSSSAMSTSPSSNKSRVRVVVTSVRSALVATNR